MRTTGQSTIGYPWHHWFDWCEAAYTSARPKLSRHTYSYSMGIGDARTVKVAGELSGHAIARRELEPLGIPEGTPYRVQTWRGGTAYHYGLSPPRYPVPVTTVDSIIAIGSTIDPVLRSVLRAKLGI